MTDPNPAHREAARAIVNAWNGSSRQTYLSDEIAAALAAAEAKGVADGWEACACLSESEAFAAARREGIADGAEAAIRTAAPYFGGLAKFYDWSAEVRALSHQAPAAAGQDGRE